MSPVWIQGVSTTSAPTANGSGNGREWIAISRKNPFEGGTRPWNEQPRPPGRPQRTDPPQLISICLHCHLEECHPESRECPLNRQYRRRMEIPKDLAELARTMTYQELGDHYCVSPTGPSGGATPWASPERLGGQSAPAPTVQNPLPERGRDPQTDAVFPSWVRRRSSLDPRNRGGNEP